MKKTKNSRTPYDDFDTTEFINPAKPLKLKDIGLKLPSEPPTKIISIRLPTKMYNDIKSRSTNIDMPYQAYIKYLLNEGLKKSHKHI